MSVLPWLFLHLAVNSMCRYYTYQELKALGASVKADNWLKKRRSYVDPDDDQEREMFNPMYTEVCIVDIVQVHFREAIIILPLQLILCNRVFERVCVRARVCARVLFSVGPCR